MDISIKTEGLDEARKTTEDLMKDFSTDMVSLTEGILKRAKEICNDPECKKIKRIKTEYVNDVFTTELSFSDAMAIDCMIQAIREKLDSMPQHLQQIYNVEIKNLEKRKKQFKNQ